MVEGTEIRPSLPDGEEGKSCPIRGAEEELPGCPRYKSFIELSGTRTVADEVLALLKRLLLHLEVCEHATSKRDRRGMLEGLRGAHAGDMRAFLRMCFDHREYKLCRPYIQAAERMAEQFKGMFSLRKWLRRMLDDSARWWERMHLPSQWMQHEAFPGLLRSFRLPRAKPCWEEHESDDGSGFKIVVPRGWKARLWIRDKWLSEDDWQMEAPSRLPDGLVLHVAIHGPDYRVVYPLVESEHRLRWSAFDASRAWARFSEQPLAATLIADQAPAPPGSILIKQPSRSIFAYGGRPWVMVDNTMERRRRDIVGYGKQKVGLYVDGVRTLIVKMPNFVRSLLVHNPYDLIGKKATLVKDPLDGDWRIIRVE